MDVQAALRDGYSKQEVMAELGRRTGMKYQQALNDGHSEDDVIAEMTRRTSSTPSNDPASYPQGKSASEAERMRREFMRKEKGNATLTEKLPDTVQDLIPSRKTVANYARPTLAGLGAALGGISGAAGGAVAGGIGALPGSLAGAGLGYAAGETVADLIEGNNPQTLKQAVTQPLQRVATGAAFEGLGQAAIPAVTSLAGLASKGAGYVAKPLLGRLSGTGTGAVETAIQSGMKEVPDKIAPAGASMVQRAKIRFENINPLASKTAYDKALRGQIAGDDIVDNARAALNSLKDQRSAAYQTKLQEVEAVTGDLNIQPISNKIQELLTRYNVKFDPASGIADTKRMAMGKSGRKDVEEILDTLVNWGKEPGDMTATGLDTLKRQLDDFYSDSSQARQFVTSLRDTVRRTISDQVPAYDEMTKGYSEATKLIKDIEAGLMMRKQGMTGRVVADQTLRRLLSATKDNFELRRELVDILGNKGGQEMMEQISGYSQRSPIPLGLAGTGPALVGQAAFAQFVNPKFWPVLAASSPRVQGEFLRMLGKTMRETQKVAPAAIKAGAMQGAITANQEGDQ